MLDLIISRDFDLKDDWLFQFKVIFTSVESQHWIQVFFCLNSDYFFLFVFEVFGFRSEKRINFSYVYFFYLSTELSLFSRADCTKSPHSRFVVKFMADFFVRFTSDNIAPNYRFCSPYFHILNQVIFGKAWYYCKKIWDLLVWKNLQRG
jgi:hypothetical protein